MVFPIGRQSRTSTNLAALERHRLYVRAIVHHTRQELNSPSGVRSRKLLQQLSILFPGLAQANIYFGLFPFSRGAVDVICDLFELSTMLWPIAPCSL